MKKFVLCFAAAALLLGSCERSPEPVIQEDDYITTSDEIIPGQYIVMLKGDFGYVKSGAMGYDEAQLAMTADLT